VVEPNREQLATVGARIAAGELRPIVGGTWPRGEGRAAFAAKQRGRLAGKAVLHVVDGGARLVLPTAMTECSWPIDESLVCVQVVCMPVVEINPTRPQSSVEDASPTRIAT
jgi:hypothetical protein